MSKAWDDRWQRYDLALKAEGIPGKLRAPLRGWVEGFLKTIRPRKWWAASPAEVTNFLSDLGHKGRPEWQLKQANLSLRIFFQEVEPTPWARSWTAQPEVARESITPSRVFLDRGPLPECFAETAGRMDDALSRHGYAERTQRAYCSWVRRFLAYCRTADDLSITRASEYLDYLAGERGVSALSRAQAINALRFFFAEVLQKNLRLSVSLPAQRRRQPVLLGRPEIEALLQALPSGFNRTLAQLLLATGMTLAQAVRLRVRDLDFRQKAVTIESGSDLSRSLPLPGSLEETLRVHLESVQKIWEADRRQGLLDSHGENPWRDCWVFPSERLVLRDRILRGPIHPQSFQQLLSRAAKRASLSAVTPHTLRQSFAVLRLQDGADPRTLQKLLGHADLSSAMAYARLAESLPVDETAAS